MSKLIIGDSDDDSFMPLRFSEVNDLYGPVDYRRIERDEEYVSTLTDDELELADAILRPPIDSDRRSKKDYIAYHSHTKRTPLRVKIIRNRTYNRRQDLVSYHYNKNDGRKLHYWESGIRRAKLLKVPKLLKMRKFSKITKF